MNSTENCAKIILSKTTASQHKKPLRTSYGSHTQYKALTQERNYNHIYEHKGHVMGVSESLTPVYFCGLCLGPGNRRFRSEAADWETDTKTSRSHVSPELHRAVDPPSMTDKHL